MDSHFRGQVAHLTGLAAEDRIAQDFEDRGYRLEQQRWRGAGGEIDLIFRHGDALVFVEVKASRSFESAAARLSARQQARLCQSAESYLAGQPAGSLTDMRFDVALVDGSGAYQILENAFGQG